MALAILFVVLSVAFMVGGFLAVTGSWARTVTAGRDLWQEKPRKVQVVGKVRVRKDRTCETERLC